MNVLQILQTVSYEGNLSILSPTSTGIASSTDPAVLQLLSMFNAAGRELLKAKCWVQLKRTHTITTVAGTTTYTLPTDYYCSLLDTFWDTSNRWKMIGPLSDSQFNTVFYGYAVIADRKVYRVFGRNGTNQIQLFPDPGTGDVLTFDYISNAWILNSATWQTTVAADANTVAFDDDLMILGTKALFYKEKGWAWEPFYQDFKSRIDAAQARYNGSKKISLYPGTPYLWYPNIPEGSWTF